MGWINLETVKKLTTERPKNIYLQIKQRKNQTAYQTSHLFCVERKLKEDKLDNNK